MLIKLAFVMKRGTQGLLGSHLRCELKIGPFGQQPICQVSWGGREGTAHQGQLSLSSCVCLSGSWTTPWAWECSGGEQNQGRLVLAGQAVSHGLLWIPWGKALPWCWSIAAGSEPIAIQGKATRQTRLHRNANINKLLLNVLILAQH